MEYIVKNISKDARKFRANGRDIIVEAGKEIVTTSPPKNSNIFEVKEKIEKKKEVKKEW